jgi:hypothetical protein
VNAFAVHLFAILLIALVIWLLTRAVYALNDIVLLRFEMGATDNLRARTVYTQVNMLRRIAIVVIITIGFAAILMTFDRVRQLGTAILASAGIAGIVLGLAAQKTLGNLIAGLQIAFTQPIQIDDADRGRRMGRSSDTPTYVAGRSGTYGGWSAHYHFPNALPTGRGAADLLAWFCSTWITVPAEAVRRAARILDEQNLGPARLACSRFRYSDRTPSCVR